MPLQILYGGRSRGTQRSKGDGRPCGEYRSNGDGRHQPRLQRFARQVCRQRRERLRTILITDYGCSCGQPLPQQRARQVRRHRRERLRTEPLRLDALRRVQPRRRRLLTRRARQVRHQRDQCLRTIFFIGDGFRCSHRHPFSLPALIGCQALHFQQCCVCSRLAFLLWNQPDHTQCPLRLPDVDVHRAATNAGSQLAASELTLARMRA